MAEAIRLIIWDLDDTFWRGTLTEGGITYHQQNQDLVIALAKRGIISTICSKNDFDQVRNILIEKGVWDYFVFPSINWKPKGARIKALIEDIQLRPETILLIDDNPLNLAEAAHFVPGLQTADEKFIPEILSSPQFKGKKDHELVRLKQYKLLETRKADESLAGDNPEFLRSCNIIVEIERDIEANIERTVELINRTNQLNFTKRRLSENLQKACAELKEKLSHFTTQAGLVRVADRYGDYGFCGFYLTSTRRGNARLEHFCFSCRILNMGVEHWLYEKLGRPRIKVRGDVLSDLSETMPVDWINADGAERVVNDAGKIACMPSRIFIRGSCNVVPLMHYFNLDAKEVVGEFNDIRDSISIRRDHSLMLRYALEGMPRKEVRMLSRLGFRKADFETKFADLGAPSLRILAFWIDSQGIVFRHRDTGRLIPFDIRGSGISRSGRFALDPDSEEGEKLPSAVRNALRFLNRKYEFVGSLSEDEHARTLDVIFGAIPDGEQVFVICAPDMKGGRGGELNRRILDAATRHPGKVVPVSITELIEDDDPGGMGHFHRKVYYELYRAICAHLQGEKYPSLPETPALPVRSQPGCAVGPQSTGTAFQK